MSIEADIEALETALKAEPDAIETELYGDRYMQGPYSRAALTDAQDTYVTTANPARIARLLAHVRELQDDRDSWRDQASARAEDAVQAMRERDEAVDRCKELEHRLELLRPFMDAMAGEGISILDMDSAELFTLAFPEHYAAALSTEGAKP